MYIDKTDPHARQLVPLDKEKEFIQSYNWSHREGMKKGKEFVSVFDVTTGQLTDYKRMADHLCVEEQFSKMTAAPPKVGNPNEVSTMTTATILLIFVSVWHGDPFPSRPAQPGAYYSHGLSELPVRDAPKQFSP